MSATSLADSLAELDQLVPAAMARPRVPGVVVGLRHEGAEGLAAYGITSVEHPLPVGPSPGCARGCASTPASRDRAPRPLDAVRLRPYRSAGRRSTTDSEWLHDA